MKINSKVRIFFTLHKWFFISISVYFVLVLLVRDWLYTPPPIPWLFGATILFVVLPSFALICLIFSGVRLFQKKYLEGLMAFAVPFLLFAIFYGVPEKKAVDARLYFYTHRQELLDKSQSPDIGVWGYTRRNASFAEFDSGHFYYPIVYVADDHPEAIYDTCSAGGHPIVKLEKNWYICKRDWN